MRYFYVNQKVYSHLEKNLNMYRIDKKIISDAIYLAKGIGISLVVIGHLDIPKVTPQNWISFVRILYLFHMPLFMLLSGYLFGFKPAKIETVKDYFYFIKTKFKRLGIPYFSITLILLLLKLIASKFFELNHPINEDALKYIFLNPAGGFATLLWFIYTLFVIFVLFYPLKLILRFDILILLFSVILYFVDLPTAFCLSIMGKYFLFFMLGYITASKNIFEHIKTPKNCVAVLLVSTVLFVCSAYLTTSQIQSHFLKGLLHVLCGASGSYCVFSLCILLASIFSGAKKNWIISSLKEIGIYAMSVYLLHTIPMGLVNILLFQMIHLPASYFIVACFTSIPLGIVIPMIIHKHIINRSTFLSLSILGSYPIKAR